METVGTGWYFEDLPVGRAFRTLGRTLTEGDLVAYVNSLGLLEVLFTDARFRQEERLPGRIVPAMLAHGIVEGLLIHAMMQRTALALLEMELKIHAPVFVGDTIHGEVEVTDARRSRSKPDRGLVRSRVSIVRDDGTVAITYTPLRMVKCRGTKER